MTITLVLHHPVDEAWQNTVASYPDNLFCEVIPQKENVHEIPSDSRIKLTTPLPYDDVQSNVRFNYAMAMLYSSEGLIVENSVFLSVNFSSYVDAIKKAVSAERYIISLASDLYSENSGIIKLVDLPVFQFSGTKAMLFDTHTKTELARWILQGMTLPEKGHKDAIKSYCNEFDIPLYTLNYSLVQNIPDRDSDFADEGLFKNFVDDFENTIKM